MDETQEYETEPQADDEEPTTYAEAIGLDDFDVINDR